MSDRMNLRDQLKDILPEILPENPVEAIKGTELIRLVKYRLKQDYSDATLRYHFSIMCCDPTSPIAKVDQGQGYYLRSPLNSLEGAKNLINLSQQLKFETEDLQAVDRDLTRASRFRAFFARHNEASARFPFLFEQSFTPGTSTEAVWKFPDAAVVDWELGDSIDENSAVLDQRLLELKRNLGFHPFSLTSTRLKLEIHHHSYREEFFQCLSQSTWAHRGELVIASPVPDAQLAENLRQLGTRFGIGITSYGIHLDRIDEWPDAVSITTMGGNEFESLQGEISLHKICSSSSTTSPDWETLSALQRENSEFEDLFTWIDDCLESGRAVPFSQSKRLRTAE